MKKSLFALHAALIVLLVIWHWREPSPVASHIVLMAASTLPLLLFSRVLYQPYRNGLVFYLLLMLLYFTHAVVSLANPQGHWLWPFVELILTVAIFCLGVMVGRRLP